MRRPVLRALGLALVLALLAAAPGRAHVGSPNVYYDGDAGPYPVRVIVRPPAVIPGDAEVTVRIRDGHKVDRVSIQPQLYTTGFKGAPPPDDAKPVPGAPEVWSGRFLLMKDGSWNIRVQVHGPQGEGTAQVPMPAVRREIFYMGKNLGAILACLGLFLFVGAVSIVGAAVREGSLPPGQPADADRISRARAASVLAAFFLALIVWGGKNWWNSTDAQLREKVFQPFGMRSAARLETGRPALALTLDDPRIQDWPPLIPDHGKLMHMFLMREPGLDAFAHLHPVPKGKKDFLTAIPPLPAGSYRVYADIVDENGFPQTLVDRVKIPAGAPETGANPALDPDDSWRLAGALDKAAAAGGPASSPLEDGGTMVWQQEPLAANQETTLRFEIRGPDGRPATLEPYMGMAGHAIITRDDGQVFVHLHPMGTVSMAAQKVFAENEGNPAAMPSMPAEMAGMDHPAMAGMNRSASTGPQGVLSFPYEFPKPGRYRLWVQVKSQGRILTGVFNAEVRAGATGG
jgi:hypothetical protein